MTIGIIPALAGNTSPSSPPPSWAEDHPRSRGEYRAMMVFPSLVWGSSPLSRGIRERCCHRSRGGGIIPALAGNTPTP